MTILVLPFRALIEDLLVRLGQAGIRAVEWQPGMQEKLSRCSTLASVMLVVVSVATVEARVEVTLSTSVEVLVGSVSVMGLPRESVVVTREALLLCKMAEC